MKDTKSWKKIARLLKTVFAEIEKEAISAGISLTSDEYETLIDKARLLVLEQNGWTLQEYREGKAKVSGFSQADLVENVEQRDTQIAEIGNRHIPSKEEISQIAEEVAQKYIVPPQITNQIVKEYTVEKPRIIETTRVEKTVEKYNDKPLREELDKLYKKIDDIKLPPEIDSAKIKDDLFKALQLDIKKATELMGMPDFRKLAMGLQAQIDELASKPSGTGSGDMDKATYDPANGASQVAFASDLANYVPYTGANNDVDLGTGHNLYMGTGGGFLFYENGVDNYAKLTSEQINTLIIEQPTTGIRTTLDFNSMTFPNKTFTFPDKDGTFAMLDDVGGGGTPASPDTSIQFNDGGVFGGTGYLYSEDGTQKILKLADTDNERAPEVQILAGNVNSGDGQGGGFNNIAGRGSGTGDGGQMLFNSGNGGETGGGGIFVFTAGSGGTTSGSGGAISMTAGSAQGDGNGGDITQSAGDGANGHNARGGNITLISGSIPEENNESYSIDGAQMQILPGDNDSGTSGGANFTGGSGGYSKNGGGVSFTAGFGGYASGNGGYVNMTAGSAQGGIGAILSPYLGSGVSIDTAGTGYSAGDTLTLLAGNANATVIVNFVDTGDIATVSPNALGTGYTVNDQLTVNGGNYDGVLNVDTVDGNGGITGLSIVSAGTGYGTANGLALSGGTGDQLATVDITTTITAGAVGGVTLVLSGTGYTLGTSTTTGGGNDDCVISIDSLAGEGDEGGSVRIIAGNGSQSGGGGGSIQLIAGVAQSTSNPGAQLNLIGGDSDDPNVAGSFVAQGGSGNNTGAGGHIQFNAGQGGGISGSGGTVQFTGGSSQDGSGGDIQFIAGDTASGTPGKFMFRSGNSLQNASLDTSLLTSTDKTSQFPDYSGTIQEWVSVPASASATGTPGMMAYESGFLYVCVSTDTWQRTVLTTWI